MVEIVSAECHQSLLQVPADDKLPQYWGDCLVNSSDSHTGGCWGGTLLTIPQDLRTGAVCVSPTLLTQPLATLLLTQLKAIPGCTGVGLANQRIIVVFIMQTSFTWRIDWIFWWNDTVLIYTNIKCVTFSNTSTSYNVLKLTVSNLKGILGKVRVFKVGIRVFTFWFSFP